MPHLHYPHFLSMWLKLCVKCKFMVAFVIKYTFFLSVVN